MRQTLVGVADASCWGLDDAAGHEALCAEHEASELSMKLCVLLVALPVVGNFQGQII